MVNVYFPETRLLHTAFNYKILSIHSYARRRRLENYSFIIKHEKRETEDGNCTWRKKKRERKGEAEN